MENNNYTGWSNIFWEDNPELFDRRLVDVEVELKFQVGNQMSPSEIIEFVTKNINTNLGNFELKLKEADKC